MKLKYFLAVALIIGATKTGFAQYSQDALRFSTFQTGSTSRIKALGNANIAIGGDLTAISGNPAGIGYFTRSEFSFTPEFDGSKVNSNYQSQGNSASKNNLNLSNVAAVFYSRLNTPKGADKTQGFLSLNFGISYNRTNNYYEDVNYGGTNKSSSITDYYANDANANSTIDPQTNRRYIPNQNSLGSFANNQNLLDVYTSAGGFYRSNATYISPGGTNINPNGYGQLSNVIRTGGQSELSLAAGANYSNKLYLGVGIGITNLRYNNNAAFTENGIVSVITSGNATPVVTANMPYSNTYTQAQETTGSGFNAKFGAIFKPVDFVRVGLLVTTPTWYTIDDNYVEGMATKISNKATVSNSVPDDYYQFNYRLRTPLKFAGGLAIFIKQYGFITGDIEYLDYSTSNLSGDYSSKADNTDIKILYRSAYNARMGAEARLSSNFALRGGYSVQGNPLKQKGTDINTVSGGIGFRSGDYYIDATYAHMSSSAIIYPYEIGAASPAAVLSKTNDNIYVTFGFRF